MAGGFSVAIGSDTRLFEQGVKTGVIEPVEDAQDALQDLAKAADKTGAAKGLDKLGDAGKDAADDIEDAAKNADKALDKLGQSGKDAGNDLEAGLKGAQSETAKTTADYKEMTEKIRAETAKIKAQSKQDFEGAGGATGEFKDEALQNFSEVTSSFQGDMTSITDLAQGTFGGLASLGGPASLVFGGIAVAVGLVGQALTQSGEDSDEFKEKIQDLAQTKLGDLFGQYEDSGDDLAQGLRKWAQDADSFGGSLTDLQKNTKRAKLDAGDYASAIATQSVPKMKQLRTEVEAHIKSLDRQASAQRGAGAGSSALANKIGEQSDAAREVKKQLDSNLEVNDAYEKSLRAVAKAQGQTVEQYQASLEASKAYDDATQTLADTLSSTLADAAESSAEALDNSVLNVDDYIGGLNARTKAAQDYADNVKTIGEQLPDDLFNFVRDQGPGFSQEIATYLSASPEQQAAIQQGWAIDAQVTADTSDVDKKTAEKGREKKKGPTSEVKGDTKDVDKKVADKAKEKKDGPTSKIRADDSAVDKAMKALRDKRFNGPTAVFQVDRSSVNSAISDIRNTQITIKVKAVDG